MHGNTSYDQLIELLKTRFESHMHRHKNQNWEAVIPKLSEQALKALAAMEQTGGEPDVAELHETLCFVDFSEQTPKGRINLCYDKEARLSRKYHPPLSSAEEMAEEIGIEILTEAEYRELQEIEKLDTATSSWVITPPSIRNLGGAVFCDRRFDKVFLYHNGAETYYSTRGFRGKLII